MAGYGHPPKEFQYKPGQSGNPSGRPKVRRSLGQDVCDVLDANAAGQGISNQEMIARRLVERAAEDGDPKAISLIIMLTQQHRTASESDVVDAVDEEIIGRFGRSDPASADQQKQVLLPRPKSESKE